MQSGTSGGRFRSWLHPAVGMFIASLVFVAASIHLFGQTYEKTWLRLRVYGIPTFADLRQITTAPSCHATMEQMRAASPCDPWHRGFNYPEIWLKLDLLGVQESHTDAIGFTLVAAFVLAVAAILSVTSRRSYASLLETLAVCSPPSWYAVERGNSDLAVFPLFVIAGFLLARRQTVATYLTLFTAGVLKVFPVASFLSPQALPRSKLHKLAWALLFMLSVGSFATQLRAIRQSTGHPFDAAFGLRVIYVLLFERDEPLYRIIAFCIITALGSVVLIWLVLRQGPQHESPAIAPERSELIAQTLFDLGATTYLAVFLFSSSYLYRLIVLLLTLPFLARLAEKENTRWCGRLGLLLIASALWSITANQRFHGFLAAFQAWAAVFLFCMLLARLQCQLTWRRDTSPA